MFTFKVGEDVTMVSLSKPVQQVLRFLFLFYDLSCYISLSLCVCVAPPFVSPASQKRGEQQDIARPRPGLNKGVAFSPCNSLFFSSLPEIRQKISVVMFIRFLVFR